MGKDHSGEKEEGGFSTCAKAAVASITSLFVPFVLSPNTGLSLIRADGAGKDDGIRLFSSFPPADHLCLPFLSQRIEEKSTERFCSVSPVLYAGCQAPGPCALAGLAMGTVVCSVVCVVCSHDSMASVV